MSVHFCGRISDLDQVVLNSRLGPEVKRQILASWASDMWTVRSEPTLRSPPELLEPASIDDIMSALRSLDRPTPDTGLMPVP